MRKTRELEKECETLSILVAVQDPLKRQSSSVDPAQAKKVAASSIVILNQAKDVAANSSVIPPPKPTARSTRGNNKSTLKTKGNIPKPMNSACDHKTKVPIVVG
ncbi:hypothetical protein glysoja_034303 [Glycine soja]|uniref:Uncharacterized protein n=1 Tax=Glycine soja TaxID=3848 RepID=A0A0B2PKY7_GLYSO|nr:hypothetical protein glysoja_034303 [Glycine soja]